MCFTTKLLLLLLTQALLYVHRIVVSIFFQMIEFCFSIREYFSSNHDYQFACARLLSVLSLCYFDQFRLE